MKKLVYNLHQIYYKLGAYNRDHLQHAQNVITNSSELAKEWLELLGETIQPLDKVIRDQEDYIE